MKIALSSDSASPLLSLIKNWLVDHKHQVIWHGCETNEFLLWPEAGKKVAQSVQSQEADFGIVLCWTGTGVSIAANKFKGIRAALCSDPDTAKGARLWNNANVLCLSINKLNDENTTAILESWFNTDYIPKDEEEKCLNLLSQYEQ